MGLLQGDYTGFWWLPDAPEARVSGTLSNNNDSLRLTTFGRLDEGVLDSERNHSVVLGNVPGLGRVTLHLTMWLDDDESHFVEMRGVVSAQYTALYAYVGAHLIADDDFRFCRVSARMTYLHEWFGSSGFAGESVSDGVQNMVNYRWPTGVKADIHAVKPAVNSSVYVSMEHGPRHAVHSVSESAQVSLSSDTPLDLGVYHRLLGRFRDFLTFCVSRPSGLEELTVHTMRKLPRSGSEMPIDVKVFTSFSYTVPENQILYGLPMLLTLPEIADNFETILQKWFGLYSNIDNVLVLYLAGGYNAEQFPFEEARFITIVQALESYHRRLLNEPVQPPDVWKARRDAIVDSVADADKKWVKQQLAHSNQQTLKDRLSILVAKTSSLTSALIPDTELFIRRVRDTRNYYTHYDPKHSSRRLMATELRDTIEILTMMMEALLLIEIGFDERQAAERIFDSERFRRVGRYNFIVWD